MRAINIQRERVYQRALANEDLLFSVLKRLTRLCDEGFSACDLYAEQAPQATEAVGNTLRSVSQIVTTAKAKIVKKGHYAS